MTWKLEDIKQSKVAHLNQHIFTNEEKAKQNKYKAQKIVIDGILFHSKKEGARYLELRMLLKAGLISNLELQIPYELNEGGKFTHKYICDFRYEQNGQTIVEDVKGFKNKVYLKKRKLMLEVHRITIKET